MKKLFVILLVAMIVLVNMGCSPWTKNKAALKNAGHSNEDISDMQEQSKTDPAFSPENILAYHKASWSEIRRMIRNGITATMAQKSFHSPEEIARIYELSELSPQILSLYDQYRYDHDDSLLSHKAIFSVRSERQLIDNEVPGEYAVKWLKRLGANDTEENVFLLVRAWDAKIQPEQILEFKDPRAAFFWDFEIDFAIEAIRAGLTPTMAKEYGNRRNNEIIECHKAGVTPYIRDQYDKTLLIPNKDSSGQERNITYLSESPGNETPISVVLFKAGLRPNNPWLKAVLKLAEQYERSIAVDDLVIAYRNGVSVEEIAREMRIKTIRSALDKN